MPFDDQRQVSIIGDTSVVSHKTPNGRRTSLSFVVNHTPGNNFFQPTPDDSVLIGQNVGKLSLSPLSEFTFNNADQSFGFEVSYVMGRRHAATGNGSKKVMSMTIRELVDKLSEVEPYEPYWEDITELDLHEKRLTSLHMLDQFCGKLVTLDASKNALGHLDGVPSSIRQLKVSQNMLTELTSWDHLMNLQYVDISGNEIKSLSALRGLVHLRSIRADNNKLTSLDGLDTHDGLLTLRARDNLIEEVDFARVKMERLTELDLEGNQISSIRNLEHAPVLGRLKLARNKLTRFTVSSCIKALRQLDLSDNQLTQLDVSDLPNLHTLHVDRNRVTTLTGFSRARKLDSLSLREQRADQALDLGFLSSACEVRKLFLSGNYLGTFEPAVDFLNLQLLELANCGIQTLPGNLGQLMPNLRTLNLNFNAIRDLEPLRFIPRLKKLLVAGNRLADSTAVTELLIEFPHITQLDLRDNPVTLGFYAPMQVLVPTDRTGYVDPFMLPDADIERDTLFSSRLDEMTKLRRRLHQIVFVASCKRLRKLDGLGLDRETVLAKDAVFQTLVAEGLLPDETLVGEVSSPGKDATAGNETMRSSRWNAEDSFA
ncbi:septation initiation network scaffold cdc11 [Fusarium longipes]|uniref:Septation initiation network scaffold cdc11 n=1 Tax=Fusarium longipes TaxID=694270 RepID=A0A395SCK0_9HYPO|nr:septation initiation network scaffold cdc11 [Fusarium longipes]